MFGGGPVLLCLFSNKKAVCLCILHPESSALNPAMLNHYHCVKPASSIKAVCLGMVIVDGKVTAAASVELVGLFYLYSRSLLSTHATASHRSAGMLRTRERQEGSHAVPRAC